jgi:uncharacterized protein involved in cysteine biosynthesis
MELLRRAQHRVQDFLMRYVVLPCLLALLVFVVGVKVCAFVSGWLSLWADVGSGSLELAGTVAGPIAGLFVLVARAIVLPVVRAFLAVGPLVVALL